MDGWIVLRTPGRSTLKLAEHLAAGGFSVWAPSRQMQKRAPRRKTLKEWCSPILPSFVFARAQHVHALLILSESPSKSCPDFSVFKHNGGIPVIADAELTQLRFIEKSEGERWTRQLMKRRAPAFDSGDVIRIHSGSFAGLSGVVEADDGRFAEVCFGPFKVKISTFLLRNDMSESADIAA
jgi:hypothetical protein